MIRALYGEKGTGKTKILVDAANKLAEESKGDVVFIDRGNRHMYDLNHRIRFININEYPILGQAGFLGFLSGVVSQDYDIDTIIIDGLTYITKQKPEEMEEFFNGIKVLSETRKINFILTITGPGSEIPAFIEEFTNDAIK